MYLFYKIILYSFEFFFALLEISHCPTYLYIMILILGCGHGHSRVAGTNLWQLSRLALSVKKTQATYRISLNNVLGH